MGASNMSVAVGHEFPVHDGLLADLDKEHMLFPRQLIVLVHQMDHPGHGDGVADHGRLRHAGLYRQWFKFAFFAVRLQIVTIDRIRMLGLDPDYFWQPVDYAGFKKF